VVMGKEVVACTLARCYIERREVLKLQGKDG